MLASGFRKKLRYHLQQMLAAAHNCRETQAATLTRLLHLNRGSQFQHHFGLTQVHSIRAFQRALPVAGYERAAPYVELLKQGQTDALLGAQNRLLMFALTSGTTSETKFIPITRQFVRDYRRGWQVWGIRAFDAHPTLHESEIFQLTSPWNLFHSPGGVPCGHISGLVQRMQNPVLRCMFAVPTAASLISDSFEKLYFGLKHGLCYPRLGMISTANPSTLCQMFHILQEQAETLVRDLFQGTDSAGNQTSLPVRWRRVKNVVRARALDRILQSTGRLSPREIWPELSLISVWTAGSAAAYLPLLREQIGEIPIRDHGLHASEGRMTIPLEDESAEGLLDIGTHFFEFIPENEMGSPDPHVLLAHELVEDETYYIVLTTSSGMYRYDIHDVVQCTGFLGTTPLLRFLHKGSHISNLTGEKLTESQVVQAVTTVARRLNLQLDYFTMIPQWGNPPRYLLLVDECRLPRIPCDLPIAEQIEVELLHTNLEYHEKRRTMRLGPVGLLSMPSHEWQQFINNRQAHPGSSVEQYKHPFLIPKLDFLEQLQERNPLSVVPKSDPPSPTTR